MKPTLLLTLLPLAFSMPQALAKSDLEVLRARCAEQERQIRELEIENAKLRSLHDQPQQSPHLKSASTVATEIANVQSAQPAGTATSYEVRPGDSWERIAGKYATTPAALARLNGTQATRMLHAGQKLKVPGTAKATIAAAPAPAPATTAAPAAPQPETPQPAAKVHLVKQGETFYSIGKKYGISTDSLMAANPDIKASTVRPGLQVKLTQSTSPATAAAEVAPEQAPPPVAEVSPKPAAPAAATRQGVLAEPSRSVPVTAQATPAPKPASVTPPATKTAPDKARIKSVTINGKTTFGEFAARHGSDVGQLNDLNALDLVATTVLAKGSELYVPAQP